MTLRTRWGGTNRPARHFSDSAPPGIETTDGSQLSASWTDRWGDGFPEAVRLDQPGDRAAFTGWFTYLAELQFYHPAPAAASEIRDCAALVRFAFRNALMAHTPAWAESAGVPAEQEIGDIGKLTYPGWALGSTLFRTRPGPFTPRDLTDGAFAQFADAATLLHCNTFFVSRRVAAAQPGDLLFYNKPGQAEPYHAMVFVGHSYFQPQEADWIVYHTGDLDGWRGEVREVEAKVLLEHPDPRWRPLAANPRFLGVYRFDLLR